MDPWGKYETDAGSSTSLFFFCGCRQWRLVEGSSSGVYEVQGGWELDLWGPKC